MSEPRKISLGPSTRQQQQSFRRLIHNLASRKRPAFARALELLTLARGGEPVSFQDDEIDALLDALSIDR